MPKNHNNRTAEARPSDAPAGRPERPQERISRDEAIYLSRLVQEKQVAQLMLNKYLQHISDMHKLTQVDTLNQDGTITRAPRTGEGSDNTAMAEVTA